LNHTIFIKRPLLGLATTFFLSW